MSDLAVAAGKGRRTLYSYFDGMDQIYKEVIQQEINSIYDFVLSRYNPSLPPRDCLRECMLAHLDAVKDVVTRNGSLKNDFFRDIYLVERSRRRVDNKEIQLFRQILAAGVRNFSFLPMNLDMSATILFYALKGIEVPYIRQSISTYFEGNKHVVVDFILRGIMR
jgi:AcrR family transcriptional regulator